MIQRLRLDQTSNIDPSILLERISTNGISQDVCINDLGMFLTLHISFFLNFFTLALIWSS
jgi:hypothetical protein